MDIFTRKYYAEKIDHWLGGHQIIVLIGYRRVGKSFIMKDFMNCHASDDSSDIISLIYMGRSCWRRMANCISEISA